MQRAAPPDPLAAHCAELLAGLGPVRMRRMFGGHGFYVDDVFVAILAFDKLFLKVDAATEARFREAGGEPFSYEAKGRGRVSLHYWTAPADAMESPALMRPWARLAMAAALAAANAPRAARAPKARPKPKPDAPAQAAPARPVSPRKAR